MFKKQLLTLVGISTSLHIYTAENHGLTQTVPQNIAQVSSAENNNFMKQLADLLLHTNQTINQTKEASNAVLKENATLTHTIENLTNTIESKNKAIETLHQQLNPGKFARAKNYAWRGIKGSAIFGIGVFLQAQYNIYKNPASYFNQNHQSETE